VLSKKRQQSCGPISNGGVTPPFLTNEEVDALRKDLSNMTIQPISSDIGIF